MPWLKSMEELKMSYLYTNPKLLRHGFMDCHLWKGDPCATTDWMFVWKGLKERISSQEFFWQDLNSGFDLILQVM